jgi:hypothetical protein
MGRWEDEVKALGVDPAEAVAVLRAAASAKLSARDLLDALRLLAQDEAAAGGRLSAEESAFLARHGGELPHAVGEGGPVSLAARRAAAALQLRRSALTVDEAAELLEVASHVVVERVRGRALYAVDLDGRLVLPRWQFGRGEPLPHLARVLAALPAETHPLTVEGFMTHPSSELGGVPPVQWLTGGGDPGVVLFAMTSLTNW